MKPSPDNLPSAINHASNIGMEEVVLAIKTLHEIRFSNFKKKLETLALEVRKFLNNEITPNKETKRYLNKIVRKAINESVKRNFLSENEKHYYQKSFIKLLTESISSIRHKDLQRNKRRRDYIKKESVEQQEISSTPDTTEISGEITLTNYAIKGITSNVATLFCQEAKLDEKCQRQQASSRSVHEIEKLRGKRKRKHESNKYTSEKDKLNVKQKRKRVSFKYNIHEKLNQKKAALEHPKRFPRAEKFAKSRKRKITPKYVCKSCIDKITDIQCKKKLLDSHKLAAEDANMEEESGPSIENDKITDLNKPSELNFTYFDKIENHLQYSDVGNQDHKFSVDENKHPQYSDLNQVHKIMSEENKHVQCNNDLNQQNQHNTDENPKNNFSNQINNVLVTGNPKFADSDYVFHQEMME